ncbi:MAG: type VI secretion system baseplate subunit TssE [Desulfovermiculus sp.]
MQVREERLLERMRRVEEAADRTLDSSSGMLKNSITRHLRLILNTRQGSAQIAPDFGLPDFTNMISDTGPQSMETIQAEVRRVVLKYEPRLADIQVIHHQEKRGTTAGLTFRLSGNIRYKDRQIPVVFETVLEPDGKISISD